MINPECRVVGLYGDAARAQESVAALRQAGVDPAAITLAGERPAGRAPTMGRPSEAETPFLGRLVLIIVLWSIVGTGVGVVMGLVLGALGIGPQGVAGMVIQIVSWAIFAHLIAGLWAGYALLSSRAPASEIRTSAAATAAGRTLVSVRCGEDELERIEAVLRASGAVTTGRYDAAGRPLAP